MREKHLERVISDAVELSLILGEGFVRCEWDTSLGTLRAQDENGKAVSEGDIRYSAISPTDIIRDYTKTNAKEHDWYIVRSFRNKYTIAAQHPQYADRITAMKPSDDYTDDSRLFRWNTKADSDDICVYEFYHEPTPALPTGRYMVACDSDLVLIDVPLPYRHIPVYRVVPEEQRETCFGYSPGFDLLPIQSSLDGLYSTTLTNQKAFGVQSILNPRGSNVDMTKAAEGMMIFDYDPGIGEPKALQLTSTPPEIFNFMGILEKTMETISGVNSVARGNPESSLKSGAALVMVQSMAVQFSQTLQRNYISLLEDVGTATINILKDFATTPRVAAIVGKANQAYLQEFSSKDLQQVDRVTVDAGNPLARTTAGKTELANTLLQAGQIENPDQYIQVLTTGRIEPVIESKQAQIMLIRSENERLAKGESVQALTIDKHAQHILEHSVVLSSPSARENPEIVQTVLVHIMEHINFLKTMDPMLAHYLGQQAQPMQPMPGVPGQLNPQSPIEQSAQGVQAPGMPSMPDLPEGADVATQQAAEQIQGS